MSNITRIDASCSQLEDINGAVTAKCTGATWRVVGLQLKQAAITWIGLVLLVVVLRIFVWGRYIEARKERRQFISRWFGSSHRRPTDVRLENVLSIAQGVCSCLSVATWIVKTYAHQVSLATYCFDFFCSCIYSIHLVYILIQHSLEASTLLGWHVLLDALTIPPMVTARGGFKYWLGLELKVKSWLSFSYFRVFHVLRTFAKLSAYVERDLDGTVVVTAAKILELTAVIVILSSTLLIFESLGNINSKFTDTFFLADGGYISFFQMTYFVFTTISTVGYGDFAPTTVLGRLLIIPSILLGVTFFSVSSAQLIKIRTAEASGRGRYHPRRPPFLSTHFWKSTGKARKRMPHVVVLGGGVTCGSATVLEPFLRQLCRAADAEAVDFDQVPEVVLLARSECSESVRSMLTQRWAKNAPVRYFVGVATNVLDLDRVRVHEAGMAFILANINAEDPGREDLQNILHAVALKRACPRIQLRLMLLTHDKLGLAVSTGVDPLVCVTVNDLKANLLLTSLIHPGFLTLALNLVLSEISLPALSGKFPRNISSTDRVAGQWRISSWLREYAAGTAYELVGFLPNDKLINHNFRDSLSIAGEYDVTLLGMQLNGRVELNPRKAIIKKDSVLFAMVWSLSKSNTSNSDACRLSEIATTWDPCDWYESFQSQRHGRTLNDSERHLFGVAAPPPTNPIYPKESNASAQSPPQTGVNARQNSKSPVSTARSLASRSSPGTTARTSARGSPGASAKKTLPALVRPKATEPLGATRSFTRNSALLKSKQGRSAFGSKRWMTENRPQHLELYHGAGGRGANEISPVVRHLQSQRSQLQKALLNMAQRARDRLMLTTDGEDINDSDQIFGGGASPIAERLTPTNFIHQSTHVDAPLSSTALNESIHDVIEQGDHIVVIIQGQGVWQQVVAVLAMFRCTHTTPVVLVGQHRPPTRLLSKFERVYYVSGAPERLSTLIAAGIVTCARMISLLPNAPPCGDGQTITMDEQNLICVSVIETQLGNWKRSDMHCVYDWYALKNIQQLPHPPGTHPPSGIHLSGRRRSTRRSGQYYSSSTLLMLDSCWSKVRLLFMPRVHDNNHSDVNDDIDDAVLSPSHLDGRGQWSSTPADFAKQGRTRSERRQSFDSQPNEVYNGKTNRILPAPARRQGTLEEVESYQKSQPRRRASRPSIGSLLGLPPNENDEDRIADGQLTQADSLCATLEPRADMRFAAGRILPKSEISSMMATAATMPAVEEVFRALVSNKDNTSTVYTVAVEHDFVGLPYRTLARRLLENGAVPLGILRRSYPMPFVVTCGPAYQRCLNHGDAIFVLADVEWDLEDALKQKIPPSPSVQSSARNVDTDELDAAFSDVVEDNATGSFINYKCRQPTTPENVPPLDIKTNNPQPVASLTENALDNSRETYSSATISSSEKDMHGRMD